MISALPPRCGTKETRSPDLGSLPSPIRVSLRRIWNRSTWRWHLRLGLSRQEIGQGQFRTCRKISGLGSRCAPLVRAATQCSGVLSAPVCLTWRRSRATSRPRCATAGLPLVRPVPARRARRVCRPLPAGSRKRCSPYARPGCVAECCGYGRGGHRVLLSTKWAQRGWGRSVVAPRHGFEPRFTAPKAAVLPLDDRGRSTLQMRSSPV